jgi:hypothetical protein
MEPENRPHSVAWSEGIAGTKGDATGRFVVTPRRGPGGLAERVPHLRVSPWRIAGREAAGRFNGARDPDKRTPGLAGGLGG